MESRTNAADEVAVVVRNGRCLLKSIKMEQRKSDAPVLYLQIFNTNAPTVGITAPVMVLQVSAGSTNLDVAIDKVIFDGKFGGKYLATGFSYAVTATHDGAGAPDAGDEPTIIVHYENLG